MSADGASARLARSVYGDGPPAVDPAEDYHEASKLHPATLARELRGIALLETSAPLRRATARSVRRHRSLPRVKLPEPDLGARTLAEVVLSRRSVREFGPAPLSLDDVATLLWAAYGTTGGLPASEDAHRLRTAPSAGALYPLELYLAPLRVEQLEQRLHHYDPLAHALERLPQAAALEPLSPDPSLPGTAAAVVLLTAVFWRSRVKYGLRAYRFTLLEAGHVLQTLLLAAEARGLGAVVVGGLFDDLTDRLLGLDGVDESILAAACVGRR